MANPVDIRWMEAALIAAANFSGDPRTQNGAVIVTHSDGGFSDRHVLGANHFPKNIAVTPERLDSAVKLKYMQHAERSAIYSAAALGVPTLKATMYCPWFACLECSKAIIGAGIARVVGLRKPRLLTPDRWSATIAEADALLHEAGVITDFLEDEIGVEILFNGEKVVM
jgi:dCMP deaminase